MLRFLIAGFGSIGKRHFENLRQMGGIEVSILSRRSLSIPGVRVYGSMEEASREQCDAVFIANETAMHIPTAVRFAERGYNLFIEKPLSNSLMGVDKLSSLATEHKLKIMIGCNMRFHPAVSLGRDYAKQGRIGRIVSAQIQAGQYLPAWRPWQDYRASYSASVDKGGGVILDLIHELDYACWFFGEASKVSAFAGSRGGLGIETEDLAEILIEFRSGVWCGVHLDYLQHCPSRSFKLIGTEGVIQADLLANEAGVFRAATRKWEALGTPGELDINKMYVDEVRHYIDYISGRCEQPLVGLDDGIKALEIALAAKESSRSGKVIELGGDRGQRG